MSAFVFSLNPTETPRQRDRNNSTSDRVKKQLQQSVIGPGLGNNLSADT